MNQQILLAARPEGYPKPTDFELTQIDVPRIVDGQFLVQAEWLSVDPYMRGRMTDAKSYADPVAIGEVMVGESVGKVIESKHPRFSVGSYVSGMFGWQSHAASDGTGVRRLTEHDQPVSTALHVRGMPGMTAYFGLMDICRPTAGQTLVVSGAAGAVGSIVGQLAKQAGCRVVGVAGSDEKIAYVIDELGFDDAFNYKSTKEYVSKFRDTCPDGIDAYFDNVGGPITDAVFPNLNVGARIAICGQISQYNLEQPELGPRLLWHLIVKRANVQGFLVMDYVSRFREAINHLSDAVDAGKLKYRERITDGLENAPLALIEMLQGKNIGKQLVRII